MKTTTKAERLPADLQTAVDAQFQRSWQVKREGLTSMIILPSAARNAPSMARIAILTASLAYIAILTASLVNRAQLAASLAAMFRQHHYDDLTIDRIATHLQNLYIIQTQF